MTDRLPDLVAALRSLESHYQEHRRQFRAGIAGHQRDYAALEAQTKLIRNFESSCISGLVQTPDYARFRLAEAVADVEAAHLMRFAADRYAAPCHSRDTRYRR